MLKLIIATTKQLFRNKEAMFWSLVFPLLFILIFSIFNFGGSLSSNILIIDNAENQMSAQITDILQNIDGIGINTQFDSVEEAKKVLAQSEEVSFTYKNEDSEDKIRENGDANIILVIPEAYGEFETLQSNLEGKFTLQLYYDEADEGQISPSGIVESILNDVTTSILLQSNQISNPFIVERNGISVRDVGYFDTLVPGILGMGIMQSGIIGISSTLASLKEKRILKRLSATPLSINKFLFAEVVSFLLLSILQVSITIVMSKFILGANIYGSIPLIFTVCFIANFVFLSLGFIAAALTKTANAAGGLAQVVTTPMMFLSGVFFSRDLLPESVKTISDLLPLSPLIDALREIAIKGAGLQDIERELLILLVWTLLAFLVAAKLFKFEEE